MTRSLFASSSASSSSQHASPQPGFQSLNSTSDAFIPPPPPEPAPRRGFQRIAAALRRRRQTVSNSPAASARRGMSQTSSIASTVSTVSTDENHELQVSEMPSVPRFTSAPTPPPSFASKPRLRYSQSQHFRSPGSPYWMANDPMNNMPPPPTADPNVSAETSPCSTPFLPNMDKEKLTPCQRQMYEKLRLVNERLLLESQGPSEKRRTTH